MSELILSSLFVTALSHFYHSTHILLPLCYCQFALFWCLNDSICAQLKPRIGLIGAGAPLIAVLVYGVTAKLKHVFLLIRLLSV